MAIDHIHLARSGGSFSGSSCHGEYHCKICQRNADDLLSTLYLAVTSPVILAPAMNVNMWHHPAVQANLEKLRSLKVTIIPPEEGYLAEGIIGIGRLAALERIVETVVALGSPAQDLAGETYWLQPAPLTRRLTRCDTSRIAPRGKWGTKLPEPLSCAERRPFWSAARRTCSPPENVEWIAVRSAEQMHEAVSREFPRASILIKAAAVSDFRPKNKANREDQEIGAVHDS